MFVYQQVSLGIWDVGFYSPHKWIRCSDHTNEDRARQEVHFLNGGGTDPKPVMPKCIMCGKTSCHGNCPGIIAWIGEPLASRIGIKPPTKGQGGSK